MTVATDAYCTPKWLADRVGVFDTDPCSNPRSHITATTFRYSLETGHDGLKLYWFGRTWMNHPYSDPMPWMRKLAYERGVGRVTESLVLAKLDPSTEWWAELTALPCDLWVFRKRINFDIPPDVLAEMQRIYDEKCRVKGIKPGKVNTSNNFASVLVHHGTTRLHLNDVAQLWTKGNQS